MEERKYALHSCRDEVMMKGLDVEVDPVEMAPASLEINYSKIRHWEFSEAFDG